MYDMWGGWSTNCQKAAEKCIDFDVINNGFSGGLYSIHTLISFVDFVPKFSSRYNILLTQCLPDRRKASKSHSFGFILNVNLAIFFFLSS